MSLEKELHDLNGSVKALTAIFEKYAGTFNNTAHDIDSNALAVENLIEKKMNVSRDEVKAVLSSLARSNKDLPRKILEEFNVRKFTELLDEQLFAVFEMANSYAK